MSRPMTDDAKQKKRERDQQKRRLATLSCLSSIESRAVRCPGCGGKVQMPCTLCALRSQAAAKTVRAELLPPSRRSSRHG